MADHESQDRRPSATAVQEINEHQRIRNEKLAQQKIEIGIIDRKLAAIGAKSCGGWDARDHDAFLRSWAQSGIQYLPSESNHAVEDTSPDNPSPSINSHISHIPPKQLHALRKRLSPILPGMDMDSIDQHIEWYFYHDLIYFHHLQGIWRYSIFSKQKNPFLAIGRMRND